VYAEDTVENVEARLARAILENAKTPGIKPVYTLALLKEEASRLHQNSQPVNSNQ
jgi:hypothetical protein